jgi:hypothetical protein
VRVRTVASSIVLTILLVAPTAAHGIQTTLHSTTTGVDSWNFDDGSTATNYFKAGVKVKDTKADNHAVYSTLVTRDLVTGGTSPEMRLNNNGGYGSTAKAGPYANTKVVRHRGSVNVQLAPDRHGATRYPG